MTRPVAPLEFPAGAFDGVDAPVVDPRLESALGAAGATLDTGAAVRADHARDWWPLSIADTAVGRVAHWPAVVAFATSIDQVRAVVDVARERGTPLTPQGGRSGVVGGAAAPEGAIALDLTGLDRVLQIDDVSRLVRVEAGVSGPDLQATVNARGFTVGHFPQSFALATVGGWVACRGGGQDSKPFRTIADIVRGRTVVLASGEVVTLGGRAPREALGPDLVALFVGSEGALGVIVEATLALHPLPAHEARAAYGFASFAEGPEARRRDAPRGGPRRALARPAQRRERPGAAVDEGVLRRHHRGGRRVAGPRAAARGGDRSPPRPRGDPPRLGPPVPRLRRRRVPLLHLRRATRGRPHALLPRRLGRRHRSGPRPRRGDPPPPRRRGEPGRAGPGRAAVVRALAIDVGTTSVRTALVD